MRTTEERAVTPVIGVVLLVVVTAVLGAAVATGVFGSLGSVGSSAPDADFAFLYTEAHDAGDVDSFGMTGQTGADGMTQITVETAQEGVPADELFIVVAGTESSWMHHKTQYSTDDTISTGDKLAVWAEQGDEVQVVWRAEDEDSSAVLDSFSVPNVDQTSSIPTPDVGCPWVESQLNSGSPPYGDLTIDGIVVECDLDNYDVHKLVIKNDGAVIGEVEAAGDIDMSDGATYDGDFETLSGGNIDLDAGSEVNGDVDVTGDADIGGGSAVAGDLVANGANDVTVTTNSRIKGRIETTGNVDVDASSTIEETITAEGNINVHGGATVQADVESTNSGSITLTDGTVLGALATAGDVDVDGSVVQDHVYVDNSFSCASATIDGQSCGSYTPKDYSEY